MSVAPHEWQDDRYLLDGLADAIRAAGSAGVITEHGRGAYAWRTIDQDLLLASLSFDSALAPPDQRRADAADGRVLVFSAAPLSVELEVRPEGMAGQIVPPGPAEIHLETTGGPTAVLHADDAGFFQLSPVPRGPVRLRCDTPVSRLVTEWVPL